MYIDNVWCLNCGYSLYIKNGIASHKRQKIKCCICGTQTIIGAMRQGETIFNESKLLPFLLKENHTLTNGELYSLGFLVADSSVSPHVQLRCNILKQDVQILQIIKKELCIKNNIKYYINKKTGQNTVSLTWQYKYAYAYLVNKGLCLNKTGNEMWLDFFNNSHFIRGFLDGDGCLFINKHKYKYELSFTSSCYQFLSDFNDNLKLLYGANAFNITSLHYTSRTLYRITIYKHGLLKILHELYKDSEGLRLERNYSKYLEILNS